MDIRAYLKTRNLADDKIEQLVTDPAYSGILESFIQEAEQGKTALQNAQQIEANLKQWNETEVVPYVRAADEKVAKREAELAGMKAHMKALKDAGYDIPDAYLEASANPNPAPKNDPPPFDPKVLDQRAMEIAETNMALVSLSNRHRKLTGDELDLDTEYADFKSNRRPDENLRSYVARKYDHTGLQAKAQQAAEQKKLDEYAQTKVQEALAAEKARNGVNPETRNPRASKWDSLRTDETRTNLWQTRQGREEATRRRLEKYVDSGASLVH
jgi:hypothetical protein